MINVNGKEYEKKEVVARYNRVVKETLSPVVVGKFLVSDPEDADRVLRECADFIRSGYDLDSAIEEEVKVKKKMLSLLPF